MAAVKQPSYTQQNAIDHARRGGGVLYRHPGGYWNNSQTEKPGLHDEWFGTQTVTALVHHGWADVTRTKRASRDGREFAVEVTIRAS